MKISDKEKQERTAKFIESRTWTLSAAVNFVNELLPEAQARGWSLGLHGSVLYRGSSVNDLDVIAYPLVKNPASLPDSEELLLGNHGFRRRRSIESIHEHWRSKGSLDEKQVEVWWTIGALREKAGYPPIGIKKLDLFYMA